MGDKTSLHHSKTSQGSSVPEKTGSEVIWHQISKGDLPPKDRQVVALIEYGNGLINYLSCYGADLLLGRKQDQYCGAVHIRDWWTALPPPPDYRYSERLKCIINIKNRFEE